MSYLTFIASDEMEGRDTPSRGLDLTAKFLAMNLGRWGFKPAGDNNSFFQRIDLRRDRADSGQTKVEYLGRTLTSGTDYLPAGGSGTVTGQIVFAGTGWFVKSKEIDAYKGINPAGKIAVIFGTPNERPRGVGRADLHAPEGGGGVRHARNEVGQFCLGLAQLLGDLSIPIALELANLRVDFLDRLLVG